LTLPSADCKIESTQRLFIVERRRKMKLSLIFALMDLAILVAYPLVYLINRVRELAEAKPARRRGQ
jgi:hypothetical protein